MAKVHTPREIKAISRKGKEVFQKLDPQSDIEQVRRPLFGIILAVGQFFGFLRSYYDKKVFMMTKSFSFYLEHTLLGHGRSPLRLC